MEHGVLHRGGFGGFTDHTRSRQDVTLGINVLAGVMNQSSAVAVAPRGLGRVVDASVGPSPHQLRVVSLTPFDRGQGLHPLLDGDGENIRVQRGLGQREHGFEASANIGSFASSNSVHVDDVRVCAEVGVTGDIGDERLGGSGRNVKPLLKASQVGAGGTSGRPSPDGNVKLLGRVVV